MVREHHHLSGHEFEQTLGESGRRGSLACCSPWGHCSAAEPKLSGGRGLSGTTGQLVRSGGSAPRPGALQGPRALPLEPDGP